MGMNGLIQRYDNISGLIIGGLSIAAIVIGAVNFSNFDFDITDPDSASTECKGAEKIPYYLIVMGLLLIILMLLKLFFEVRRVQ